jgi:hypothetical protein
VCLRGNRSLCGSGNQALMWGGGWLGEGVSASDCAQLLLHSWCYLARLVRTACTAEQSLRGPTSVRGATLAPLAPNAPEGHLHYRATPAAAWHMTAAAVTGTGISMQTMAAAVAARYSHRTRCSCSIPAGCHRCRGA